MENKSTFAVVSLVLGIVAIIFAFVFWPVGLVCGIIGLVLGSKAKKQGWQPLVGFFPDRPDSLGYPDYRCDCLRGRTSRCRYDRCKYAWLIWLGLKTGEPKGLPVFLFGKGFFHVPCNTNFWYFRIYLFNHDYHRLCSRTCLCRSAA